MLRLQSRGLALLGLLAMGIVAYGLLQARLTIPQAALRAALAGIVLAVADRFVMPIASALVGAPRTPDEPDDAEVVPDAV